MNYFLDLLGSYEKLKKRTFKLTYLSEEEDEKGNLADSEAGLAAANQWISTNLEAIMASTHQDPFVQSTGALGANGEEVMMKMWSVLEKKSGAIESGNVVIKAESGISYGAVANNQGQIMKEWFSKNTYSRFIKQFVPSQNEKDLTPEQADAMAAENLAAQEAAEEEARREQVRTPGGYFQLKQEADPEFIVNEKTIKSLENTTKILDDFCKEASEGGNKEYLCSHSVSFLTGARNMGFEYKLANATAVQVVDEVTGITKKGTASPGLVAQAAESHEFLISFLTDPMTGNDCSQILSRIGKYKNGNMVLFGEETNEGIVISPNKLQETALNSVKAKCKDITDKSFISLIGDGFDQHEKNAVKGTFFEAILGLQVSLINKDKEGLSSFAALLEEKQQILQAIHSDIDVHAGRDIQSDFDYQIGSDLLEKMSTSESLKEYIKSEMAATSKLIQFLNPDGFVLVGTSSKTGAREDIIFTYSQKVKAEEKAKALGSSAVKQEDGTWAVGIGLKRLSKIKAAKLGEINSSVRMKGLITGEIALDSNIVGGFQKSMDARQFGDNAGVPGTDNNLRREAMIAFTHNLEEDLEGSTSFLVDNKTYIDSNGKIKTQTPKTVAKMLGDSLKTTLSFKEFGSSLLASAFFDKKIGGEHVSKKFDGDSEEAKDNRYRAREKLARMGRFSLLKKNIESEGQDSQAAKDYIIKAALSCGSNSEDLAQVIVGDDQELVSIKHNKAFDIICKANNDPTSEEPSFKFSESGVTISVGDISLVFSQEHTSISNGRSDTRSLVRLPSSTIRNTKIASKIDTPVLEDKALFQEYIKGHMKLLEAFLSPSSNNHVL